MELLRNARLLPFSPPLIHRGEKVGEARMRGQMVAKKYNACARTSKLAFPAGYAVRLGRLRSPSSALWASSPHTLIKGGEKRLWHPLTQPRHCPCGAITDIG